MATQTLIDFANENRPNCKWIFCYSMIIIQNLKIFFIYLSKIIKSRKVENFGIIGFNHMKWEYSFIQNTFIFLELILKYSRALVTFQQKTVEIQF